MADGFRVLENGDYRITEADVFRITEHFDDAFSDLSGSGSLVIQGSLTQRASYDESSEGIFSATPVLKNAGLSSLTGTGTLGPTGSLTQLGYTSLTGAGSISDISSFSSSVNNHLTNLDNFTSSVVLQSDVPNLTVLSASYALTASYANNAQLLNNTASSVFATTGSNVFKGNQVISGSLTIVTGSGSPLIISGSSGSSSTVATADTSTNATYYPTFVSSSTGNLPITVSSTKLQYNPSTGVLTTTGGMGGGAF